MFRVSVVHPCCISTEVCLVLSLLCLSTCVCVCLKSKVHCGSALEPGASGLPYYCTPPVCVPDVNRELSVWRQTTQKKQKVFLGGGVPLVGPQEELRRGGPSGHTPRGFTSSPGREAK